jgi:hypothetical protein
METGAKGSPDMTTEPDNLAILLPPDKKSLLGVGIQKCGPYTNQVGDERNHRSGNFHNE